MSTYKNIDFIILSIILNGFIQLYSEFERALSIALIINLVDIPFIPS